LTLILLNKIVKTIFFNLFTSDDFKNKIKLQKAERHNKINKNSLQCHFQSVSAHDLGRFTIIRRTIKETDRERE
jgi:hypothetical protein